MARKNCPTTPSRRTRGRNTTTVVREEPTTAPRISLVAATTEERRGPPFPRPRAMFSATTIALSMMSPMATAMPPRDIRLRDSPMAAVTAKVPSTETGMLTPAMRVRRIDPRKTQSTPTASSMPRAMASLTLRRDSRTRSAWS